MEALAAFLPERAHVLRDGIAHDIPARELVPGDSLLVTEGDRICADARLTSGTVEVDMSTVTGESVPVTRAAVASVPSVPLLQAANLVFSGTTCASGEAQAALRTSSTARSSMPWPRLSLTVCWVPARRSSSPAVPRRQSCVSPTRCA